MRGARLTSKRNHVSKDTEKDLGVNRLKVDVIWGDVIWVKLNGCSWWPGQVIDEKIVSGCSKLNNNSEGEVLVRLYGSYNYLYVDPAKYRDEFENILKQTNGSHQEIFQKSLEHDLSQIKSGRLKRRASERRAEKAILKISRNRMSKRDEIKKRKETKGLNSKQGVKGKHAGVIVRRTSAMDVNIDSEKSKNEAPRTKNQKQGSYKKNSETDKSTSETISARKPRSSMTPQMQRKHDNSFPQEAREEAEGEITPKHGGVKKKPKVSTTLARSQDLSARRIKVMQNLGLIAPSGSPFHRRGLVQAKVLSSQDPV